MHMQRMNIYMVVHAHTLRAFASKHGSHHICVLECMHELMRISIYLRVQNTLHLYIYLYIYKRLDLRCIGGHANRGCSILLGLLYMHICVWMYVHLYVKCIYIHTHIYACIKDPAGYYDPCSRAPYASEVNVFLNIEM